MHNVPDLRGVFIRGLDNGRAIDSGRQLLSLQQSASAPAPHKHFMFTNEHLNGDTIWSSNFGFPLNDTNTYVAGASWAGGHEEKYIVVKTNTIPTLGATSLPVPIGDNSTNPETRPINIALLPCIKAK